MFAPTHQDLESSFENVFERIRQRRVKMQPPSSHWNAPSFIIPYDNIRVAPATISIVPANLPFDELWLTTNFMGLGIVAYVETFMVGAQRFTRPDYLWYPTTIKGFDVAVRGEAIEGMVSQIIDAALHSIVEREQEEVQTQAWRRINKRRAAAKVPSLAPFIRVHKAIRVRAQQPEEKGTHASPVGHERRGHYRHLRSGKRVWVRQCAIKGGSIVPRTYHVEG